MDANPGDGLCADTAGRCTLRAAIQETNALPGADTITLPAGTYTFTIPGTDEDAAATGDLDITDSLTLSGADAASTIIDAAGLDRVLEAHAPAAVQIADVTVAGGGGVLQGAGVRTLASSLTLVRATVRANTANYGDGGFGGGIWASSDVYLLDSTITENVATGSIAFGGGIYGGPLVLAGSSVTGNSAAGDGLAWGAGIHASGYDVTVSSSAISENVGQSVGQSSVSQGGGIFHGGPGELLVAGSTISGNVVSSDSSPPAGAGLYLLQSVADVTNSTISGNFASAGSAGVYVSGDLVLRNTTIADNSGVIGGIESGGGYLTLLNTILDNDGPDCDAYPDSLGHNLDSDGTCSLTAPGDLPNTDPLLGPLADNGGPTLTHALLPGSPAIDAGKNVGCPATDQRGSQRLTDGDGDGTAGCDIGAYEVENMAEPGPPIAVGGAAGLIEGEAAPAAERSASGGAPVAALAGVASAAFVLVGGGWYLRRRR